MIEPVSDDDVPEFTISPLAKWATATVFVGAIANLVISGFIGLHACEGSGGTPENTKHRYLCHQGGSLHGVGTFSSLVVEWLPLAILLVGAVLAIRRHSRSTLIASILIAISVAIVYVAGSLTLLTA